MNIKLSGIILTKNEETNINRALRSINFCDELIVVDDYSSDKTVENAKSQGVIIFQRHLNNDFSSQRNFAMEKSRGEWMLFIDADEEISKELADEIRQTINKNFQFSSTNFQKDVVAYYIKRRDFWWGRELKWGEISRIRQIGLIRLVRKNSGKWVGKVHEKFQIPNSKFQIQSLRNYINHYPHPTIKEFLGKVNFYSTLRAEELYEKGERTNIFQIILYPFFKFFYTYLLKLGILDGVCGFVYSFMMSFHSFLVRAKLYLR